MKEPVYTSWVLVCDRGHARIFAVEEGEKNWTLVHNIENPEGRLRAREIDSDKPGRTQESSAFGRRSSKEPHTDPTETEAQRFAEELSELLDRGLTEGAYSRLLVAAPPHFLGILRAHLSEQVEKRLTYSIDHDYTWVNDHELPSRLGELLP
jgi:protein required for attachment to host cells